jgi:hypothetical protein
MATYSGAPFGLRLLAYAITGSGFVDRPSAFQSGSPALRAARSDSAISMPAMQAANGPGSPL